MIPELGAGGDYNEEAVSDRGRELSLLRSGSAPPTVEGSLGAAFLDGAVSEMELRSDPAYRSYYYQNVKLNPRLPHPLPNKEDRLMQRPSGSLTFGHGGRGGGGGESLFAMQPGFGGLEEEKAMQGKWGGDRVIGYPGMGMGSKQKSIANMVQDCVGYPKTVSRHPSLMASQAFGEAESSEIHVGFHHELAPLSAVHSGTNMQSISSSTSQSYASVMGASSRNLTPDLVRSPSPRISALSGDRMSSLDQRYVNIQDLCDEISPETVPSVDIITSLSGLSLSSGTMGDVRKYQKPRRHDRIDAQHNLFHSQSDNVPLKQHPYLNDTLRAPSMPTLNCRGSSPTQYLNTASPTFSSSKFGLGGYPASPLVLGNQVGSGDIPPLVDNGAHAKALGISGVDARALNGGLPFESDLFSAAAELENFARLGNQSAVDALPMALTDPSYLLH
ncbi:pumilio homolog 2-like [Salvia miltiorrhiza]|uniref:pumilio homolog 2-like n=1 Tax=Salvia miltiorrhiza TaxID=226208 RepID=UPI0025ACA9FC|nr:pumilio homolog 2-like [Salvia miltiorrhiza]